MRVATYNIRHGLGVARPVSLERVARVIAALDADLVALNEVFRGGRHRDQAGTLARLTESTELFQANARFGRGDYGNAFLSRVPLRLRADVKLPRGRERRGGMLAEAEVGGRTACVAVTHLALSKRARAEQIAVLARALPRDMPLVLAGDLNCTAEELGPLLEFLRDIVPAPATYPSWWPLRAYDHILFSRDWTLIGSGTRRTLASDHLPLYADLRLG